MVIVGHSMGGLVANLQVTYSGDALWNSAASIPLEQLRTDPATRATLGRSLFLRSQRRRRTGDLHRHAAFGLRLGPPIRGQSRLRVGRSPRRSPTQRHAQLMRDNPDVFSDELARRFPTSVDLLEPSSPILNATARLPYRPGVAVHSIVGEGRYTVGSGPSDGVVPVSSAVSAAAPARRSSTLSIRKNHAMRTSSPRSCGSLPNMPQAVDASLPGLLSE